MKKHRIGVIGAGAIAQHCHIPGYAAAANCELVAIADPEEACLAAVREKGWRFAAEHRSHRELLAAGHRLDVVSICTPNKFHADIAVDCLDAGLDLLLEKPVALTLDEAARIADAAARNRRRVMVGFSHRFNELNRAAKAAIDAGQIGRPYMIRVRFAHTGPWPGWAKTDWFYNPELSGGGALLDMAVHAFDLVQWYQGPVRAVSARVATLRKPIAVDDNVVALVEFDSACLGYIDCGWTSPAGFLGVEIMGDNGCITVDYGAVSATMRRGSVTPDGKNEIAESVLTSGYKLQPWPAEMAYFTAALDTAEPFSPGLDAGIDTLRVVLAAYESSRSGRRVEIDRAPASA